MAIKERTEEIQQKMLDLVHSCNRAKQEHLISTKVIVVVELPDGTGIVNVYKDAVLQEDAMQAGMVAGEAQQQAVMFTFKNEGRNTETASA